MKLRDDDWDVYYERGRKPKESIIKYEAARSEGDYRRKEERDVWCLLFVLIRQGPAA